jgi:hypothetical protein
MSYLCIPDQACLRLQPKCGTNDRNRSHVSGFQMSTSRYQFHQRSTYSFYARRSRMRKKRQSSQLCHLALLGPTSVKAAHKMLVKLTPGITAVLLSILPISIL